MKCCVKDQSLIKRLYAGHGVKVGPGPQEQGPRDQVPPTKFKSGTRDPPKFKSATPGAPSQFKSGTPGTSSKFKSGTPYNNISSLLDYFVLDKYIYNKEIIFHE